MTTFRVRVDQLEGGEWQQDLVVEIEDAAAPAVRLAVDLVAGGSVKVRRSGSPRRPGLGALSALLRRDEEGPHFRVAAPPAELQPRLEPPAGPPRLPAPERPAALRSRTRALKEPREPRALPEPKER